MVSVVLAVASFLFVSLDLGPLPFFFLMNVAKGLSICLYFQRISSYFH